MITKRDEQDWHIEETFFSTEEVVNHIIARFSWNESNWHLSRGSPWQGLDQAWRIGPGGDLREALSAWGGQIFPDVSLPQATDSQPELRQLTDGVREERDVGVPLQPNELPDVGLTQASDGQPEL